MSRPWWEVVRRSAWRPAELKGANNLWESGTTEASVISGWRQWARLSSHLWPLLHLAPTLYTHKLIMLVCLLPATGQRVEACLSQCTVCVGCYAGDLLEAITQGGKHMDSLLWRSNPAYIKHPTGFMSSCDKIHCKRSDVKPKLAVFYVILTRQSDILDFFFPASLFLSILFYR